jgi:hypothetical protein
MTQDEIDALEATDAELAPAEQRRVTVWRIVRATYARLLAAREGKRTEQMFPVEVSEMLAPWAEAMGHDFRALCAVVEDARVAGVQDAHSAYHRLEAGVDHETLDQAIEVVAEQARADEREQLLEDR